jgi:deoxyribodipyrimidine photolyase-related protein
MASKPYIASGKYIDRMSNYCGSCVFDPSLATGEKACPFTTLYWDYLIRHEVVLRTNHRMAMQLKNLQRKSPQDKDAIQQAARQVRMRYCNSEL